MSLWYTETYNDNVRFGLKTTRSLFHKRSEYQLVEVFDTEAFGRCLAIDGIYMTSEGDEFYYHEMLVHPAMVTAPKIDRVLVIGGGDGGTARTALSYPQVKHVDMVEIDGVVVEACKELMPEMGSWDDPRLHLTIGDGIAYVKEADVAPYDVILLDGSDPVGPAEGLFNRDFFEGVKRVLAPGGVFALQSESPVLMPELFVDINKTLREVFARADAYLGPVPIYAAGMWSWTYASDSADPQAIDPARLEAVESRCKHYNGDIHRFAFALPNHIKRALGT